MGSRTRASPTPGVGMRVGWGSVWLVRLPTKCLRVRTLSVNAAVSSVDLSSVHSPWVAPSHPTLSPHRFRVVRLDTPIALKEQKKLLAPSRAGSSRKPDSLMVTVYLPSTDDKESRECRCGRREFVHSLLGKQARKAERTNTKTFRTNSVTPTCKPSEHD